MNKKACAYVLLLTVLSCADELDENSDELANIALPLAQTGTAAEWVDVGPLKVMPASTPSIKIPDRLPKVAPEVAERLARQPTTFAVDDLKNKRRYKLKLPANWQPNFPAESLSPDLDLLEEAAKQEQPGSITKGWSDNTGDNVGDDNRVNLSTNTSAFLRRIGQLGNDCSGTMIRQTVNGTFALTAAHCVFDAMGNAIQKPFEPARGSANTRGAWDILEVIRYDNFLSGNCHAVYTEGCLQWDIAMLRLTPRAGTTYIGGAAYGVRSPTTLTNASGKVHRGYPNCFGAGDPVTNCVANTLWGDQVHTVGNFAASDRTFQHSSDQSGGHSGGPHYYFDYSASVNNNVVFGVNVAAWCTGTCTNDPNQPRVNLSRRIDQNWYDIMFDLIN